MRLDIDNIPSQATKINHRFDTQLLSQIANLVATIVESLDQLPFTEFQIAGQAVVRGVLDAMEIRSEDEGFLDKFDLERYEFLKRVLKEAGFDLDKPNTNLAEE
ncbi:hypothetical protein JDFnp1_2 [Fusobacterium phage JD-Fnp1]|nr:hypothetical protein JDFnp1_2 [Fusobacterium phage JD-Fnp1]